MLYIHTYRGVHITWFLHVYTHKLINIYISMKSMWFYVVLSYNNEQMTFLSCSQIQWAHVCSRKLWWDFHLYKETGIWQCLCGVVVTCRHTDIWHWMKFGVNQNLSEMPRVWQSVGITLSKRWVIKLGCCSGEERGKMWSVSMGILAYKKKSQRKPNKEAIGNDGSERKQHSSLTLGNQSEILL